MGIKELNNAIRRNTYFPKYSGWVFMVLFLSAALYYNYQDILPRPPQSLHQWRQADCLSLTTHYYEDNNPFLEPSIHYLGNDGTGKTVSDFPLIYFSVAQLWKLFGPHEFIYRLLVLLLFFSGIFAVFKTIENLLRDSILAIVGALFLFTSPVLVYYANNFLMDIPAFSMALVGLYFFTRFYKDSNSKHFYFFVFFYALAGLLKIPSLLSFMAIFGLFFLELVGVKIMLGRKVFSQPIKQGLLMVGVLAVQLAWYKYAAYYNGLHNGGIFLIGTLPLWELNSEQISQTLNAISQHIKWDYFRRETQVVFLIMFISTLVFFKKAERGILLVTLILALGLLAFVVLFFQPLKDHDYYTINLFVMVPLVLLSFFLMLKNGFARLYSSTLFRILLIVFLVHNADFASKRLEARYSSAGWENETFVKYVEPFTEIKPYLRSIGIRQDDRVISISDNSINITLYLMNQNGWTNYGVMADSANIADRIALGAKYLFVYKPEDYNQPGLQPFIKKKIGTFKNIDIFSLEHHTAVPDKF